MRLLVIQKILIVAIVVAAILSVTGVIANRQPFYIALFFTVLNILGSDFVINSSLIDVPNRVMLGVQVIDVAANIMLTILITTVFYQLLSRLDLRYIVARSKARRLSNHVILTPANEMSLLLSKRLKEKGIGSVVVDKDYLKVVNFVGRGVLAYHGNPTDQGVLEYVQIGKARSVITLDKDDASNLYIAMSARKANGSVRVVSRLKRLDDMMKLEKSGVNRVVLPEFAISKDIGEFLTERRSQKGL